jgi:hypothetical protein
MYHESVIAFKTYNLFLSVLSKVVTFRYSCQYSVLCGDTPCDNWVPPTTAWRFLRLWIEERPPIWRVAANILNKQSRTADKEWSSSLGVGRSANNASP